MWSSSSPISVSGVPHGCSHPRYVTNDPDNSNPRLPPRCPAANATRWRRSTTHSPRLQPFTQLVGSDGLGKGKIHRRRAFTVDDTHVRVVGGVCREFCQQLVDEVLFVLGQRGVALALLPDRRRVLVDGRGGAEAAEP